MTDMTTSSRGSAKAAASSAPSSGAHTIEDVIERGMCVGCGACSVATGGAITIKLGRRRSYEADASNAPAEALRVASKVCPFSDDSRNEDAIAKDRFAGLAYDERIGFYSTLTAARVTDLERLLGSSSGGLTSWVAEELLRRGRVDAILHVAPTHTDDGPLFSFSASDTADEFASQRKSMYYASTMAEIVASVRGDGRRYAVIGVPCFLRAARLLAEEDPVLGGQFAYFLGLVCGHLKSQAFAESLAWQAGRRPGRPRIRRLPRQGARPSVQPLRRRGDRSRGQPQDGSHARPRRRQLGPRDVPGQCVQLLRRHLRRDGRCRVRRRLAARVQDGLAGHERRGQPAPRYRRDHRRCIGSLVDAPDGGPGRGHAGRQLPASPGRSLGASARRRRRGSVGAAEARRRHRSRASIRSA